MIVDTLYEFLLEILEKLDESPERREGDRILREAQKEALLRKDHNHETGVSGGISHSIKG